MAGYYVPNSFSSNYVSNKKNQDGTYVYDEAMNNAGINTQRTLQQLNKQYNVSINAARQGLLANRGLRAVYVKYSWLQTNLYSSVARVCQSRNESNRFICTRS